MIRREDKTWVKKGTWVLVSIGSFSDYEALFVGRAKEGFDPKALERKLRDVTPEARGEDLLNALTPFLEGTALFTEVHLGEGSGPPLPGAISVLTVASPDR